jgi:hypothetical protein
MTKNHFTVQVLERQQELANRISKSGYRDMASAYIRRLVRGAPGAEESGACVFDDPEARLASFDGAKAEAHFIVSTARSDRYCDIVRPKGCLPTIADYQRNPVVFFSHQSNNLPIGTSLSIHGEPGVSVTDSDVRAKCRFHLKSQVSEEVCKLVEADELRCASIGFMPILAKYIEPQGKKPRDVAEAAASNGVEEPEIDEVCEFLPWKAFDFLEWSLYEWSVVPVPANPDCISMRLSRGFGGKPLSEPVARLLAPFAAPLREYATGSGGGHVKSVEEEVREDMQRGALDLAAAEKAEREKLERDAKERLLRTILQELASLRGTQSDLRKQLRSVTGKVD